MSTEQNNDSARQARARRNILTAAGLGLVAVVIYVGYFLYKLLT